MEYYLRTYGYLCIILWAFLGGEECVIVSGLLASEGYLSLTGVIIASVFGGALGDQIYFYMAHKYGERLLKRSKRLMKVYPQAMCLVQGYGSAIVLFSRFLAGLRIAIALACGAFGMPAAKYSVLNLISALLWSTLFSTLAYHFGRALSSLPSGWPYFSGLLLGALLITLRIRFGRKRQFKLLNHDRYVDPS